MSPKKKSDITSTLAKARWIIPVALWAALSFLYYDFLLKVEERSIFEFDLFWFRGFLDRPAGLLSWLSLFFTQFMHIPWLGSLIWALLLSLSAELTCKVFRIPATISAVSYIPAAIFVAYNMSMGYMIYIMNHQGFFLMPTLGYLWALFAVVTLRISEKTAIQLPLYLLFGFAGYYIAGFYGLAGILAAAIDNFISERSRTNRISVLVCSLATIILAPVVFAGTTAYYLQAGWTAGLPDHIHSVPLSRMQFPIIIAMLFPVFAHLLRLRKKEVSGKSIPSIIQGVVLIAIIVSAPAFWYNDSNFKTELRMIRAMDNLEWNKVTDTFKDYSAKAQKDPSWQPTRVMVLLKDLALAKTGQEGERAFAFEDGSMTQNRKWDVPMSMQIGWILGFQYGIPGLCQRWCFEESTVFGWNFIALKYYAMTAILFNNKELSEKYLNILSHTLFYRKWAQEQLGLYQDRSLVARTEPYDQILPMLCYDDKICSDLEGCEIFLRKHFNGTSPQNSTPQYDREALFWAMKSKDATLFWTRFFIYLDSNNPKKIDRFYQEAAYLYSNLGQKNLLKVLPFDEKTKETYNAFMTIAEKLGPKSLEESHKYFPENLRHTYYYYYYYVNKLSLF